MNQYKIEKCPQLFMSANWYNEKKMVKLFVAGLNNGVRGFDTAREYGAEKKVGRAIKTALQETGLSRSDVFIQSRICNEELVARANISREVNKSLEKMGLEYFDCFMFHWPTPNCYIKAWNELIHEYETSNSIKSIGLCNCRKRHIEEMEAAKVKMLPQILQIEITPFWQVNELKSLCDEKGIKLQAFSPLCKMIRPIRENKTLLDIANNHHVSIAQIILRWHIQRGISPISSSSKVERIKSNFDIMNFSLSDKEMQKMSLLDCGYKYHLESSTCFGY